ncbi:glycosyltransferase family 2 protein [Spirosoma lituiforme]
MLVSSPIISVIIPTYNSAKTLQAAIDSVRSQKYKNIELIVIDGNSTDNTKNIIDENAEYITKWVSESDSGIYEAMNKGIEKSTGDWLYFLGSDDQLCDKIIEKILVFLNSEVDVVYGDVVYDTGYAMRSCVGIRCLLENRLHHQSAFYHRSLFNDFRYDTLCRVNSDYELTLRIYLQKRPTVYVPFTIAVCGSTGVSSTLSSKETNYLRGLYVKNLILNNTLSAILDLYYFYFRTKILAKSALHDLKGFK